MIVVGGQQLDVDVAEELEIYADHFKKMHIRDNKLQSCSPFRYEKTPSFAVDLITGSWIDSGANDEKLRKGHFLQLLSFLMQTELIEAEAYLIERYGVANRDVDTLKLTLDLGGMSENKKVFSPEELQQYAYRHKYLGNRGISEAVQRAFKIGYDKEQRAVSLPWFDKVGNIINIKFRSVETKKFYYADGQRIKHHLYGLHMVNELKCKDAVIVESETDCLYCWSNGIPAIACGSASLSSKQFELLRTSRLESITIAVDNDLAGQRFKDYIKDKLVGDCFDVYELKIPQQYKDVNDMTPNQLLTAYKNKKAIGLNINLVF